MAPNWTGSDIPAHRDPEAPKPTAQYPDWMKYGLRAVIALLALIAFMVWRANGGGQECLVTATGEKLCGGDAVAWCDATDVLRDESLSDAQAVCDAIRD